MKLATALLTRAELNKKLSELETRLANNARVQEGEQPAESPAELLAELESVTAELESLIARINLTNAQTAVDGITITERLAHRDLLMRKQTILRNFLWEASALTPRGSRSEIRQRSTVNVREMNQQLDALSKELRETEEKLQELNWTVELL